MNWLLAYLLLFLNLALLVFVGIYAKSWKSRVIGGILLILPVPLYLVATGYFTAYYQHVRDCKADGGLKVLIQPEKVGEIQMDSKSFFDEKTAQDTLHEFYPHLKIVEAVGNSKDMTKNAKQYFSYSVMSTNNSKHPNDWTFNKTALIEPSADIYVISHHQEDSSTKNYIQKFDWALTKKGQLYAKVTNYIHTWTGIRYPDAVPFWSCRDGYSEEYAQPEKLLIKLILKAN
jgi:hypothetical protein